MILLLLLVGGFEGETDVVQKYLTKNNLTGKNQIMWPSRSPKNTSLLKGC